MEVRDLIGRTLIDILGRSEKMDEPSIELDYFESFILLDDSVYISIPWSFNDRVDIVPLPKDAKSLVLSAEDTFTYTVRTYKHWIMKMFFGKNSFHSKTPEENKMKNMSGKKITDLLSFSDEDKVFVELENGYIFSEVQVAPQGTGYASLHLYENKAELQLVKGDVYVSLKGSY